MHYVKVLKQHFGLTNLSFFQISKQLQQRPNCKIGVATLALGSRPKQGLAKV